MKIASFCISFYKIKKYSTMVSFSELNLHSRSRQPSDLYLQLYFLEEFKVCIRISSNWAKNIQKKIFTLTFCRQIGKKILYSLSSHKYFLLLKYEWTIHEKYKKKYHKFHNRVIQRNLCILCKLIINAFKFIWKKTCNEIIKPYFCRKNKNKTTMPFVFNIPCWRKKEKKNN